MGTILPQQCSGAKDSAQRVLGYNFKWYEIVIISVDLDFCFSNITAVVNLLVLTGTG